MLKQHNEELCYYLVLQKRETWELTVRLYRMGATRISYPILAGNLSEYKKMYI